LLAGEATIGVQTGFDSTDGVPIGPTGVWAIEKENVAGKVEIDGDSLRIRGYRQDKMVDQVYREATAVNRTTYRASRTSDRRRRRQSTSNESPVPQITLVRLNALRAGHRLEP
jgi:hypothetical protein